LQRTHLPIQYASILYTCHAIIALPCAAVQHMHMPPTIPCAGRCLRSAPRARAATRATRRARVTHRACFLPYQPNEPWRGVRQGFAGCIAVDLRRWRIHRTPSTGAATSAFPTSACRRHLPACDTVKHAVPATSCRAFYTPLFIAPAFKTHLSPPAAAVQCRAALPPAFTTPPGATAPLAWHTGPPLAFWPPRTSPILCSITVSSCDAACLACARAHATPSAGVLSLSLSGGQDMRTLMEDCLPPPPPLSCLLRAVPHSPVCCALHTGLPTTLAAYFPMLRASRAVGLNGTGWRTANGIRHG